MTRNLTEFYHNNDGDCRAFAIARGFNIGDIDDLMSNFYMDLSVYHSLDKFKPEKSTFETYIFNLLGWRIKRAWSSAKADDDRNNRFGQKLDEINQITVGLASKLDDYISFLHNSGLSCTGVYQVSEYITERSTGAYNHEMDNANVVQHRTMLHAYEVYTDYGIGITGAQSIV
jgi:hypothetical protein